MNRGQKLRHVVRGCAMGRLHGIPWCCVVQWSIERALAAPRSERRMQYGSLTSGRVPCSLHAALLGEPSPGQKEILARRARAHKAVGRDTQDGAPVLVVSRPE